MFEHSKDDGASSSRARSMRSRVASGDEVWDWAMVENEAIKHISSCRQIMYDLVLTSTDILPEKAVFGVYTRISCMGMIIMVNLSGNPMKKSVLVGYQCRRVK